MNIILNRTYTKLIPLIQIDHLTSKLFTFERKKKRLENLYSVNVCNNERVKRRIYHFDSSIVKYLVFCMRMDWIFVYPETC